MNGTLLGFEVRVSPYVYDMPKVRWVCAPEDETKAIQDFNKYLEEMFGFHLTYIRIGKTIVTNERGYAALKETTQGKKP